ncbi:hypothetical protein A1Q1_04626 [Trichosporon asahii var. asahii CBS 2479]|uniref:Uncharacterized protein n=1 Tax=Trichosporon asahii var. asahii (strain ATCC 90039 / CBS 2479 / JCM 2466 / KCTC 7840 / NBRC 103889/ NCYC 2677 / UAMH 7654) TaxID=1186058 RepID=J6F5U3_TRIAS|nr:hypothetical protein A1Q1_04626 [Trichosporon asahii var. asahii CBS 2479]EJT52414.1 hypothetical protein A1Q1_04626 [Trichosporon asahii var. asahii CBS 2479]
MVVFAVVASAGLDYYRQNWTYEGLREQERAAQMCDEPEVEEKQLPTPTPPRRRWFGAGACFAWLFRSRRSRSKKFTKSKKSEKTRSKRSSMSTPLTVFEVDETAITVPPVPSQPRPMPASRGSSISSLESILKKDEVEVEVTAVVLDAPAPAMAKRAMVHFDERSLEKPHRPTRIDRNVVEPPHHTRVLGNIKHRARTAMLGMRVLPRTTTRKRMIRA